MRVHGARPVMASMLESPQGGSGAPPAIAVLSSGGSAPLWWLTDIRRPQDVEGLSSPVTLSEGRFREVNMIVLLRICSLREEHI